MSFLFWHRWLLGASVFFVVFGIAAALAPDSFLFAVWIGQIDRTFFGSEVLGGVITPEAKAMRGFLMGPLGGTIAGSYLIQVFVVAVPFARREAWAWHALLWPMLLWFCVDSLVSGLHGAWFNIYMINLMPLVVFGIPLFATRSIAFGPRPVAPG